MGAVIGTDYNLARSKSSFGVMLVETGANLQLILRVV